MTLNGKVVLITGASIGIGSETAKLFSKEKCKLVLTYYKDKEEAEKTAAECRKHGAEVFVLYLDVVDNTSIADCVKKTLERFQHVDILINNAAVIASKPLLKQTNEEIELQIRTNLEGLIKLTKAALPHIKETLINIASQAGITAYEELTTYCATKFGVRGFTQGIAKEHPGLFIVNVNPGLTATRMTNFEGVPPLKVAEVILKTAQRAYPVQSGGDVNVWEH